MNGDRFSKGSPFLMLAAISLLTALLVLAGCGKKEEPEAATPTYLVVLELTTVDCGECIIVHQILQDLKPEYEDRLSFITLNIDDTLNKLEARDTSDDIHARAFVSRFQDRPGVVAIIDARSGKPWRILEKNLDPAAYQGMFDEALSKFDLSRKQKDKKKGLL